MTPAVVFSLPFAWVVIRRIGVDTFARIKFSEPAAQPTPDSKSLSDEKEVYA